MARTTIFADAGTTATTVVMASYSASIPVQQDTTSTGTFPTSKLLKHPISTITVQNLDTTTGDNLWFRTDGVTAVEGAAGTVYVGQGQTVTVPCGAVSGSVTLKIVANQAGTPYTARLG